MSLFYILFNMKLICAQQKKKSRTYIWILRILGSLLFITSLGFNQNSTLIDTDLSFAIQKQYPSWYAFFADLLLLVLAIGLLAIFFSLVLKIAKNHKLSKKTILKIKKTDIFLIRSFLNILSMLTNLAFSIFLSIFVWSLALPSISYIFNFNLPQFNTQPVIFSMGIVGLVLFFESFEIFKKKIQHFFCIRCF